MAMNHSLITDRLAIYNADCVGGMRSLPDAKVHFSIYSPPFPKEEGNCLYEYSNDPRDLSNCRNAAEFMEHYAFVVQEISRVTMPGRLTAVHCTDVPSGNSGKDYLYDFPGEIIRLHHRLGFRFVARHTIWKEPLWVRNRTMTKNLAHRTVVDDAAYAGVASADYLLVFRKEGTNPVPIANPTGLEHYAGECPIPQEFERYRGWKGDQKENRFSHWIWRRYASSIWDDIDMQNVLPFQDCKDPDDEKHVHPLQLDVIERAVTLRTNPGETVLTPFMGVGSEVFGAVKLGRKAIGFDLKNAYFRQAVANLEMVDVPRERQPRLEIPDELEAA